jgi:hypothetical protein
VGAELALRSRTDLLVSVAVMTDVEGDYTSESCYSERPS